MRSYKIPDLPGGGSVALDPREFPPGETEPCSKLLRFFPTGVPTGR